MGVLADWQIKRANIVTPFEPGIKRPGKVSYGCSSYGYDVRIGHVFKVFTPAQQCSVIDPKKFDEKAFVTVDLTPHDGRHEWDENPNSGTYDQCIHCGAYMNVENKNLCTLRPPKADHCIIPPNSFALGESIEHFNIPRDVLCVVLGKSTYARCGIIVNVTPGEPEWRGKWTIEISNTTPLPAKIYAGEGIMQAMFFRTDGYRDIHARDIQFILKQLSGNAQISTDPPLPSRMSDEENEQWVASVMRSGTCEISYADKAGKYQDQKGIVIPKVDGVK